MNNSINLYKNAIEKKLNAFAHNKLSTIINFILLDYKDTRLADFGDLTEDEDTLLVQWGGNILSFTREFFNSKVEDGDIIHVLIKIILPVDVGVQEKMIINNPNDTSKVIEKLITIFDLHIDIISIDTIIYTV